MLTIWLRVFLSSMVNIFISSSVGPTEPVLKIQSKEFQSKEGIWFERVEEKQSDQY